MMIKKDYLDSSVILANCAKSRLNPSITNEEKEIDNLYFYCLSRLAWDMNSSSEPKKSCMVDLVQYCSHGNNVTLFHGRISAYTSRFVTGSEFYSRIQKVADIFNDPSLPNYCAICGTTPGTAFLNVFLENFS